MVFLLFLLFQGKRRRETCDGEKEELSDKKTKRKCTETKTKFSTPERRRDGSAAYNNKAPTTVSSEDIIEFDTVVSLNDTELEQQEALCLITPMLNRTIFGEFELQEDEAGNYYQKLFHIEFKEKVLMLLSPHSQKTEAMMIEIKLIVASKYFNNFGTPSKYYIIITNSSVDSKCSSCMNSSSNVNRNSSSNDSSFLNLTKKTFDICEHSQYKMVLDSCIHYYLFQLSSL
jgi:hypothetical protein